MIRNSMYNFFAPIKFTIIFHFYYEIPTSSPLTWEIPLKTELLFDKILGFFCKLVVSKKKCWKSSLLAIAEP